MRPFDRVLPMVLLAGMLLGVAPVSAQDKGQYQVSGGLGISFAPDREGGGVGGSILLERSFLSESWGGARIYAGGLISEADHDTCTVGIRPCSISSQIAVTGAKLRLVVPIPYVGPFFEFGAGLSVGSIESRLGAERGLAAIDERHTGVMFHVPVSLGLSFGSRHQHDLSIDFFSHPGRSHVAGSFSLGIGFVWR